MRQCRGDCTCYVVMVTSNNMCIMHIKVSMREVAFGNVESIGDITTSESSHVNDVKFKEVRVIVPINIALIKYWGKRDEEFMLPLNDSFSVTINDLCAETRVRIGKSIVEDTVSINGTFVDFGVNSRYSRCFSEFRKLLHSKNRIDDMADFSSSKFEIVSETSFPVGAGLASSAAGFGAIAYALGILFDFNPYEVSYIARMGSGSACRSVLSGFVHWHAGKCDDGTDCSCETVVPEGHWPSLCALIVITSREEKAVSSKDGMRSSAASSELLEYRAQHIASRRIEKIKEAILQKDFQTFAKIVMKDSNQLHAICMDTYPPIKYLTESSWHLINLVNELNKQYKGIRVAHTFDAGPNCCLFTEFDFIPVLLAGLKKYCGLSMDILEQIDDCKAGRDCGDLIPKVEASEQYLVSLEIKPTTDVAIDAYLSYVGMGPQVIK